MSINPVNRLNILESAEKFRLAFDAGFDAKQISSFIVKSVEEGVVDKYEGFQKTCDLFETVTCEYAAASALKNCGSFRFAVVSKRNITEDHSWSVYQTLEMVRIHLLAGLAKMEPNKAGYDFKWIDIPSYCDHMIEGTASKSWLTSIFCDSLLEYDGVNYGTRAPREGKWLNVSGNVVFHREIFNLIVKPKFEELLKSLGYEVQTLTIINKKARIKHQTVSGIKALRVFNDAKTQAT